MQNTSIQTDRLSAAIARMAECFARTIIDMQNFGASNSDASSHSESQLLVSSIKEEKSRKNTSALAGRFLDSQPTGWSRICSDRPHQVLGCWPMWPSSWGFLCQRFHRFLATKPVCSETNKAERRSSGDHSSIRDSWPMAFSGYPRGPRVGCETWCP